MAIGQTTGEAKAGGLGKTGNAPYCHFFPAPVGFAEARLDDLPHQNAMSLVSGRGIGA